MYVNFHNDSGYPYASLPMPDEDSELQNTDWILELADEQDLEYPEHVSITEVQARMLSPFGDSYIGSYMQKGFPYAHMYKSKREFYALAYDGKAYKGKTCGSIVAKLTKLDAHGLL